MNVNFDQFATSNKAAVDSLLTIGNTVFSSVERVAALNLNTMRDAIKQNADNLSAVLAAKDPQAAIALQSRLAQGVMQKAIAYNQSLIAVATDAQQDLTQIFQGQVGGFKKSIAAAVEQVSKTAPAGSEVAVAALKQAVDTANASFENMNNVAKQLSTLAQDNVSAVTSAVTSAVQAAK